jgi:hypothetical protein
MLLTIEELALKKSFLDLSFNEKQLVLSKITEKEYNDIRLLLIKTKASYQKDFETFKVKDTIKEELLRAFKQKHTKQRLQPAYMDFLYNYKKIIRPAISLASIVLLAIFIIKNTMGSKNSSLTSTDTVSFFLNENKELLKVNTDYSSYLIDSNKFNRDSIIEMNTYLHINTDGLHAN